MKTSYNYPGSVGFQFNFSFFSFLKIALFGAIFCISFNTAEAQIDPFDINQNGIADRTEAEVVVESNLTLPAGEYFFNNLTIRNGAIVTAESDYFSVSAFKGVKINAVNLTISSTSIMEANGRGYGYVSGPGTPDFYTVGASYGGIGLQNSATSTYGSALRPLDLGSAGYYNGGGAIWLVVTQTLVNDGLISADGQSSASGGSIYVTTGNLAGTGIFQTKGGGLFASGHFKGPGGGGRIALHYRSNFFTGVAWAKGGCGSYDGWTLTCAGDGTVGLIDVVSNNIHIDSSWRFQKTDSPLNFNSIFITKGAKVSVENDVNLSALQIVLDQNSTLSFLGSSTLRVPFIKIDGGSTVTLSGEEHIVSSTVLVKGNSILTVVPGKILFLSVPNLTVTAGSSVLADAKGYISGPGTPMPGLELAGASYGGVGLNNTATSTYGSEREPIDFGSGGSGYSGRGGGAVRLYITNALSNDGTISAHGENTSSGGSVYVIAKNIIGTGSFGANGGNNYCPNVCVGSGGGGRIAIYYETSSFNGEVLARAGLYCYYGCSPQGGNGTVVFEQKQAALVCTTGCYSNVLFLPGLEASRLYKNQSVTCQLDCEDQLWESNKKTDVEDLYLNADGTSKNTGIYTRDAIKETNTPTSLGLLGQNIYKSFFATLDGLTDPALPKHMARWEAYAYDWRQSVDDIVNNGTRYEGGKKSLIATLENLVASSTTGKVTIIAHSNGGLLAKALLVKLQQMKVAGTSNLIDKIDVLVLVASPQIGTPSAVPALLHGYNQRIMLGVLMDEEHARELGRNMLGGYGLLPSRDYLNRVDSAPVTFTDNAIPSGITTNFVNAYGSTTDSYLEYKNFLLGNEGRTNPPVSSTKLPIKLSQALITQSESLHTSIDAWVPPVSLRVVEVAGWGLDTIASFEYYPKLTGCTGGSVGCSNPYTLDERPIFTIDGDKTVVEPSALYMPGEKYWVNLLKYNNNNFDRIHKDILEVQELISLISSIITRTPFDPNAIVVQVKPVNTSNRLRLSIHSPVSIGAYDSLGNFTGKVCSDIEDFCYIQENISNSSYLEFGEGKYVNIPEESLSKVILKGTDIGTFTFEMETIVPNGESTQSVFSDILVTTQTKGEVMFSTTTRQLVLTLDVTGDGITDFIISPNPVFDPILFLKIMRKTVESLNIASAYKNNLYARIDAIIVSIQTGKLIKTELKAEKFKGMLNKSVVKQGHKKITDPDALVLVIMLENLLANLEK